MRTVVVVLCAEATRLAEPLSEFGDGPLDKFRVPCTELVEWQRQYNIAALTLASFADWDRRALRKAHESRRTDGWAHHLLWSASTLCEWPPVHRLALLERSSIRAGDQADRHVSVSDGPSLAADEVDDHDDNENEHDGA